MKETEYSGSTMSRQLNDSTIALKPVETPDARAGTAAETAGRLSAEAHLDEQLSVLLLVVLMESNSPCRAVEGNRACWAGMGCGWQLTASI
jgi:hypothetical protein